jgi:hypothetical protein
MLTLQKFLALLLVASGIACAQQDSPRSYTSGSPPAAPSGTTASAPTSGRTAAIVGAAAVAVVVVVIVAIKHHHKSSAKNHAKPVAKNLRAPRQFSRTPSY